MRAKRIMSVDFNQACHGKDLGWKTVYLPTMYYDYDKMVKFLAKNCKQRVRFHAAMFLFEDVQDATKFMFSRWKWA